MKKLILLVSTSILAACSPSADNVSEEPVSITQPIEVQPVEPQEQVSGSIQTQDNTSDTEGAILEISYYREGIDLGGYTISFGALEDCEQYKSENEVTAKDFKLESVCKNVQ